MAYEQLKLDNQLCFRLYTASRLVSSAYTPFFKEHGITYPQYLVLMLLWEKDGRLVGEIAESLHLETNTVTPLLQRMQNQGLVARQAGSGDARQRVVTLTAKGRALEERIKEVPGCIAVDIMNAGMTVDEVRTLVPLLDKLIGILL